ncbi:MAG: PglZ domain-containing protein [Acidimicrobiales bacterium]
MKATVLRDALAVKLAEKCSRHHLVVWDDPDRQYEGVAEVVVPAGWQLVRYEGSWWDLRRRAEPAFSGPVPPKLVLYVPAPPPAADPMEELRQAGASFKRLLPTLLKEALAGDVGPSRIAELSERCPTLAAAEEALAGGGNVDPALIAATGAHDPEGVLAAILVDHVTEGRVAEIAPALAALGQHSAGWAPSLARDLDALRASLARHLVLATIADAADDAAKILVPHWEALTPSQTRTCRDVVERVSRPATMGSWGALADRASADLRLAEVPWRDGLATCDVARVVDELAYHEAVRRLGEDPASAHALAAGRIASSRWLRWRDYASAPVLAALDAVRAVARLRVTLAEHPVPGTASLDGVYRWYLAGAWKVDRSQRLMEGARMGLDMPGLDRAYTEARDAYLAWLDRLLDATQEAARGGCEVSQPSQGDIWAKQVEGSSGVALVIVDAMRLEIGHRLAELLERVVDAVRVEGAVAVPPTITAVGMASLLPDAAREPLAVDVVADSIVVRVGDRPVRTVADRTAAYRVAAGIVEDHPMSEWLSLGDDVLAERVRADLLVVRSQEIDAAGERGLASVRWSQIDATVERLAVLVSRLGAAGVRRVVITADHGFIALGRPLDASRVRSAPTGAGFVEHGRVWIGRPATVPEGCTAIALSDFGVRSAESIVVAGGMTVFAGAGESFFHGGIAPQEAVVPVVVVDLAPAGRSTSDLLTVSVEVPGGRVSAEAFSIRVGLAGSLFASDVTVRITAAGQTGEPVARLVPGEAVDPQAGTVRLDPATDALLTFLVTRNLDKGDVVAVAVLDATTGRPLADTRATVARDLRPEEDW